MARGRSQSRGARTVNLITGKAASVPKGSTGNRGLGGGSAARFPKKPSRGNGKPSPMPGSKANRRVSNTHVVTGNNAP